MGNHSVSDFGKDLGLLHEVVVTGRKVGADREFWARLAHDENFFKKVVRAHIGFEEMTPVQHPVILFTEPPMLPDGLAVNSHKKDPYSINWDPENCILYRLKPDRKKTGEQFLDEIRNYDILNLNLLTFLLRNICLIPKEWKQHHIYFFGTTLLDRDSRAIVYFLYWLDGWYSSFSHLDEVWRSDEGKEDYAIMIK